MGSKPTSTHGRIHSDFIETMGISQWEFPMGIFVRIWSENSGSVATGNMRFMITAWWLTYPSEKWWSESQLGLWHSQLNGKIKNVPNHQPDKYSITVVFMGSSFTNKLVTPGIKPMRTKRVLNAGESPTESVNFPATWLPYIYHQSWYGSKPIFFYGSRTWSPTLKLLVS